MIIDDIDNQENVRVYSVDSKLKQKLEDYFKRKGLILDHISEIVNGFAIAEVFCLDKRSIYGYKYYFSVIVDIDKLICCKFQFLGHRTDGLTILTHPKKKIHKLDICEPNFDIKFVYDDCGEVTSTIIVSYKDFHYADNDHPFPKGNIYILHFMIFLRIGLILCLVMNTLYVNLTFLIIVMNYFTYAD